MANKKLTLADAQVGDQLIYQYVDKEAWLMRDHLGYPVPYDEATTWFPPQSDLVHHLTERTCGLQYFQIDKLPERMPDGAVTHTSQLLDQLSS